MILGKVHLLCRGGGMKMLRGGTEIFSGIKGGGTESSRYTEGGGSKVLVQQGPGLECSLPP